MKMWGREYEKGWAPHIYDTMEMILSRRNFRSLRRSGRGRLCYLERFAGGSAAE